jgi:hypothetical protein
MRNYIWTVGLSNKYLTLRKPEELSDYESYTNQFILLTSPRAYPWAFELFEILWSNFPLPGQKCCSNAPHITEN